ncbi:MAG: DUF4163 domain-containing protein [Firmicutes bacterium]|nr:DUF4163 domain-containing protein [Bacillota bacterium]
MTRERKLAAAIVMCASLVASSCAATSAAGGASAETLVPAPVEEAPSLAPPSAAAPAAVAPATNLALAEADDTVPMWVDGTPLQTRGRLVDGRTMVSLKGFGGEMRMGVNIHADAGTAEITGGTRTVSFDVGKNTATVGDHRTQVSPGAMFLDGQTYAPLRFMAENMGFRVVWDATARSVALFRVEENPLKIDTVKDISETETLQVNIQYPRIGGLANKDAEAAFNEHFRKAAAACRAAGEKTEKDLKGQPNSTDPRVIQVQEWLDYRVAYNRDGIISIVLTQFEYTGGAHGMTVQSSYTMNIQTGQVYALSDLFKSDIDYVMLMSDEVKKQIAARGGDIFLLRPFEAIRKDQDFYTQDGSVVVYFQLYEYTPYVAGIQEFPVEFAALEGSLDPGFEELIMGD